MRPSIRFALLALASIPGPAQAQGTQTHPATAQEFVGYWRVLSIANEKHRSTIKNEETGYADPCQFLINEPDGARKNISLSNLGGAVPRECPSRKADLTFSMLSARPKQRWTAKPNQNGLFMITEEATKQAQFWKVDRVDADLQTSARFGFDFKKGDLIVQLLKDLGGNNLAPVWPMILRPVPD